MSKNRNQPVKVVKMEEIKKIPEQQSVTQEEPENKKIEINKDNVVVEESKPPQVTQEPVEYVVQSEKTNTEVKPQAISSEPQSQYSSNLTQLLAMVKQTKNMNVINSIDELLAYAKAMAPNKTMPTEQGAIHQANLYSTIINIIDYSGNDFRIAFSTMLCIFNEYKNAAFNGAYVFRFMESVAMNTAKRKSFIKLINLLMMTADHNTRKHALKHIDFKREIIPPISGESRMRIMSFYNA